MNIYAIFNKLDYTVNKVTFVDIMPLLILKFLNKNNVTINNVKVTFIKEKVIADYKNI